MRLSMSLLKLISPAVVAAVFLLAAPGGAAAQDHGHAEDVHGAVEQHTEGLESHVGGAVHDDHGAAGGHGDGHAPAKPIPSVLEGLMPALTALLVFGVVLAVLGKVVWPKIAKGLQEREEKILSEIRAAELARQHAKESLEQYEKSLAEARAEARRILEETKAQEQKMKADLRAQADAEVARMKEQARLDIDSAKRAALSEVYTEAAALATRMAGKILQREITPGDEQRMLQESLSELQAMNN